MAGYSGTPLPKKLGIVEYSTLALIDAPRGVFDGLPQGVTVKREARGRLTWPLRSSFGDGTSNVGSTPWPR